MFILPLSFKSVLSLVLGVEDEEKKYKQGMVLVLKLQVWVWYICLFKMHTKGLGRCIGCLWHKKEGQSLDSLATL